MYHSRLSTVYETRWHGNSAKKRKYRNSSVQYSPSWEANSCSVSQYTFRILNSWFRASWFNVNKKVQLDVTVCRHLFTAQSLYMFRVSRHPSSGVLKTVSATSGIGHDTGTATSFQRGLIRTGVSPDQATLEGSSCTSIMTYTRGSRYSF